MACELKHISFKNGSIDIAGDLRFPNGFDANQKYAALVIVTPGSSVKEQIGAVYGEKMAEKGYVTLAFDPSHQGESGGEPRDLEDPAARVEDIRCAVDFLATQSYVGEDRIGVLGICAGGGYAVNAALTEHRFKAVGTVVAVNLGRAFRQAELSVGAVLKTIEAVGKQRNVEARGGDPLRVQWIPDSLQEAKAAGIVDPDTLEAVEFYRTPRGYNKNSTNRRFFRGDALVLGFDAFHLVGELLSQPIQVIVAGRLGTTFSFEDGKHLWGQATNKKDLFVIQGAGHYDMYDKQPYVDQAAERLDSFYKEYLST
ncbi:alpha/beta hydrolase [Massilia sp. CMS3.1]|uniref:alpha/beta hydrolase n=1 Tax=Massilia sp. CMS3.1 TaxID=3373083 RepID=UPI003EE459DB